MVAEMAFYVTGLGESSEPVMSSLTDSSAVVGTSVRGNSISSWLRAEVYYENTIRNSYNSVRRFYIAFIMLVIS